jgi:hypothetical protein
VTGSLAAPGYHYGLIAALGISMGIQNASARKIAVPDLTTTVLTLTITGIAADSALAGGSGSKAGRRLLSITTMLAGAFLGAVLIRHTQACYPLVIALVVIIAGAAATYRLGKSGPAWIHAPAGRAGSTWAPLPGPVPVAPRRRPQSDARRVNSSRPAWAGRRFRDRFAGGPAAVAGRGGP